MSSSRRFFFSLLCCFPCKEKNATDYTSITDNETEISLLRPSKTQRRWKRQAPSPPDVRNNSNGDSKVNIYLEFSNQFNDDGKQTPLDEYPKELNPFYDGDDHEQANGVEYPEELNPFKNGDDQEKSPGEQCPQELNQIRNKDDTEPDKNPDHLKPLDNDKDAQTSTCKVNDYDESLNPFNSDDDEITNATAVVQPSEAPNPFSLRKGKPSKKSRAPRPPVTHDILPNEDTVSVSTTPGPSQALVLNRTSSSKIEDYYDESLNPFASDDEGNSDYSLVKQPSTTLSPPTATPIMDVPSSTFPLLNKNQKRKSIKKRQAPKPPIKDDISQNEDNVSDVYASYYQGNTPNINTKAPNKDACLF